MRTNSCKNTNYSSKGQTTISNGQKDDKMTDTENGNDSEPQPTLQNAAYKIEPANTKKCYELLSIRYYEHLETTYHTSWSETLDKNGKILPETQVKIALSNDVNNNKKGPENSDKIIFNKCIPMKNNTIYILILIIQQTRFQYKKIRSKFG